MRPVGRTTPAMANYGNASGIYGDALKNDYGLKLFDIQSTRMGSQTPHEFITKEIAPFLARAPGTLETTLRGSVGGFNNITGIVNENVRNMKGRLEYPDLIT